MVVFLPTQRTTDTQHQVFGHNSAVDISVSSCPYVIECELLALECELPSVRDEVCFSCVIMPTTMPK